MELGLTYVNSWKLMVKRWREPVNERPNLKGRLPSRVTINAIIRLAEQITKEIKEEHLDGNNDEPDN